MLFESERDHRTVVCRLIAETLDGKIKWCESGPGFEGRYHADWHGWHIVATWFQDETSLEMVKGDKRVGMSYRVMDGLREVIRTQIDPAWLIREQNETKRRQKEADQRREESKEAIEEILSLP